MKTRDLIERRAKIRDDVQAIIATPEGEGGDLSEAQEKRFDELTSEAETLEKRIDRQIRVDELERRVGGNPADTSDRLTTELRGRYSVARAIAGAADLDGVDDGFEREVAQEVRRREPGRTFEGVAIPLEALAPERRDITTTAPVAGPGGNLVAENIANEVIDLLRAQTVTSLLGVSTISGLTGDLAIPRLTKSATTEWLAENGTITGGDPEMDQVKMGPKHVAGLTAFSRQMVLQSSPDVEGLVRFDLTRGIAEAIDHAVLEGGGTNEPTGIAQTAGITALDSATSGTLAEDDVIDAMAAIEGANAMPTGFAMHPTVASVLRKLKDGDGRSLNLISGIGRTATIEGLPSVTTTNLPAFAAGSMAFLVGDFSQAVVGMWGSLDVLVNPYGDAYYSKGAIGVRAMMACDVAIRQPAAFCALSIQS